MTHSFPTRRASDLTIYFADDFLFEQGAVVLPRLQFLLGLIIGKRRVHDFGFYDSHTQDRSGQASGSCPIIRAAGEDLLHRLFVRGGKAGKKATQINDQPRNRSGVAASYVGPSS